MAEVSQALIERFFKDECTIEEAEQVIRYLEGHPSLLDIYAGRKEWEDREKAFPLPATLKAEMRERVYKITHHRPASRIWMVRSAVAACTTGLLILGYSWIYSGRHKEGDGVRDALAGSTLKNYHTKTLTNPGSDKMTFTTSDGSTIALAAHSELSYQEPFANNARDLRLKGEAVFEVVKDPARPFTVYAGGIATTALGTSFRVRAIDSESRVSVQLLTGRVSVRPEPAFAGGMKKEMYLSPGDEMIFDKSRQSMALHSFNRVQPVAGVKQNAPVRDGSTTETAETWTFFNQSLSEILGTLQAAYTTHISYSRRDLSKIRFTGTFNKSDSLSHILNTIGSMSKLQVTINGDGYKMEK